MANSSDNELASCLSNKQILIGKILLSAGRDADERWTLTHLWYIHPDVD